MTPYEEQVAALRERVRVGRASLPILNPIECALWAAVYVRVLSAEVGRGLFAIGDVADVLGDPTEHRVLVAHEAADRAVLKLRKYTP